MKRIFAVLLLAVCLLVGCASTDDRTDNSQTTEIPETDELFSDRDFEVGYDETTAVRISLNGDSAACDDDAVQISGTTVTVTAEGTYLLSGTLDDGMLIVDATKNDKIQLVFDGVRIHSGSSAALYVRKADKVFLTTAPDSQNTLSSGESYTAIDENDIDAAVFSKDDLTLNGQGALVIDAPAGHGVVCKDDLVVTSGSYTVTAARHGLSGKDSVRIAGGTFDITAQKDGIHADNSDDSALGFVALRDGSFRITAAGDGVSASGAMQVEGGDFDLLCGGGSAVTPSDDESTKGMKSGGAFTVLGGDFHIDSSDDALHSDDTLTVAGGTFELSSGDDGMHADGLLTVTDGKITILKSYEGIEGLQIEIGGGEIALTASDDGLNAAGGSGGGWFGGFGDVSSECYILISGGTLHIDADGDGIDSNGTLTVTGGETYIAGPTNGGNGALDYGSSATVSGGTLIAVGSREMAVNFGSDSTQGAMLVSVGTQTAGTTVTLTDNSGTVLLEWTPEKAFSAVNLTCPALVQGGTYTLTVGTFSESVTLDTLIYGESNGTGGFGGFGGGGFGGMGGRPGNNSETTGDPGTMGDPPELPSGMPDGAELPDGAEPPEKPDGMPDNSQNGGNMQPPDGSQGFGDMQPPDNSQNGSGMQPPDNSQAPAVMPDNSQTPPTPQPSDGTST